MTMRGFTLVEMMVVLVILGLTATFATLGFQRLENDRLEKQAGQLGAWLQAMSDNAVLDGAVYGAWLDKTDNRLRVGYFFQQRWQTVAAPDPTPPLPGENSELLLDHGESQQRIRSGEGDAVRPDILFLPVGTTSPERFVVRDRDSGRSARIERNDNGVFTWHIQ